MRIYLASRYSRHEELQAYARDLMAAGHDVTSRWIWGEHQALDVELMTNIELARRFAEDDLEDLTRATCIVSFTESPRMAHTRGGRHAEFGYALALARRPAAPGYPQMRLVVVGPLENVFYCLPGIRHYDDWQSALSAEFARKTVRDTETSVEATPA